MAIIRTKYHGFATHKSGEDTGAGQQPQRPNSENITDGAGINSLIQKLDETIKYLRAYTSGVTAANAGKMLESGFVNVSFPDLADDTTLKNVDGVLSIKNIPDTKIAANTVQGGKLTDENIANNITLTFSDSLATTVTTDGGFTEDTLKSYPGTVSFEGVESIGVPVIGDCRAYELMFMMVHPSGNLSRRIKLNENILIQDGDYVNIKSGKVWDSYFFDVSVNNSITLNPAGQGVIKGMFRGVGFEDALAMKILMSVTLRRV